MLSGIAIFSTWGFAQLKELHLKCIEAKFVKMEHVFVEGDVSD